MKTIETERLILRPITKSDADAIYEYSQNKNVGINAGWKPHESIEETHEVMEMVFLDKDYVFGITLKETGKLFGSIGLVPDPKRQNDKTRMIGYAIGEDYWGNGFATESVLALLRFGFDEMGLDLISAYCFPFNERSRNVLKKCGFNYEGRLALAEERYDGTVLDNECYAIMRPLEDAKKKKQALNYDNFFLPIEDSEESKLFYTETLSLQKKFEFEAEGMIAFSVGNEEPAIILKDKKKFPNAKPTIWIEARNVNSLYRKMTDKGMKFLMKPFRICTGWAVEFNDPSGNRLGFTDYIKE